MVEQFTKEAKQGWRFAADTAIITDENASSEDRKNTSVGVFVVVNSNLGAVVGKEERAVASIPGNEGRIAQAGVNVRRHACFLRLYFWHLARLDTEE